MYIYFLYQPIILTLSSFVGNNDDKTRFYRLFEKLF